MSEELKAIEVAAGSSVAVTRRARVGYRAIRMMIVEAYPAITIDGKVIAGESDSAAVDLTREQSAAIRAALEKAEQWVDEGPASIAVPVTRGG